MIDKNEQHKHDFATVKTPQKKILQDKTLEDAKNEKPHPKAVDLLAALDEGLTPKEALQKVLTAKEAEPKGLSARQASKQPQHTPTTAPEPAPVVPKTQRIEVKLDVSAFRDLIDKARADGYREGWGDGQKNIITTAEDFMVSHNHLKSRDGLSKNGALMPTWWLATLSRAMYYEPSLPVEKKVELPKSSPRFQHNILEDEDE
jgi:hypothetical protein